MFVLPATYFQVVALTFTTPVVIYRSNSVGETSDGRCWRLFVCFRIQIGPKQSKTLD